MRRSPLGDVAALGAGWWHLTRLHNAIIASGYTLIGRYLARGSFDESWSYTRPALIVLLVVCFGNVINDLIDHAADAIAYPTRPIPSGAISRGAATSAAVLLAAGSVALAVPLGARAAIVTMTMLAIAAAYSLWLKETLLVGNAAVAVMVGTTPLFGALVTDHTPSAVYVASGMTFLFVLSQEVLFTLEDERFDEVAGLRTTANRLGTTATQALFRILILACAVAALMPALRTETPRPYLYAAIPCIVVPASVLFALFHRPASAERLRTAARFSRLLWITGILPLILLRQ